MITKLPVLGSGEWLDSFYNEFVFVENADTEPKFILDPERIQLILPQIIEDNEINYAKISLIHMLKIYNQQNEIIDIDQKINKHLKFIWIILVLMNITFFTLAYKIVNFI